MPTIRRLGTLVAPIVLTAALLGAETLVLRNGDRITGKLVTRGTRRFRVQTPYGMLAIPRDRIEKIVRDDGTEERLNPPTEGAGPAPLAPQKLALVVTGASFWQAWDPKAGAPPDPSLRLEVRLDERPVARYLDATLDPEDIRGAVVNTFSFTADSVKLVAGSLVELAPPSVQPGRILLELRIPPGLAGARRLWVTYQGNDGSAGDPIWRDLVGTLAEIALRSEGTTIVQLQQDRGQMEFSGLGKRRMKNVETFRLLARPE